MAFVKLWGNKALDWVNEDISRRIALRRVDILIVISLIGCTAYYYRQSGIQGALAGAGVYLMVLMASLWLVM